MKSGDKVSLRAYKNLKAEIQKVKTAKNAKPYTDASEIQLISKMCKNLEDAILDFSKAHREDLVADMEWSTSMLNDEELAIPTPDSIKWDTAYLEGDFVRTTKNKDLRNELM